MLNSELLRYINIRDNYDAMARYTRFTMKRCGKLGLFAKLLGLKGKSLGTDRQARLVRPLYFGLLNETQTDYARKRLIQALERYGWLFTIMCGVRVDGENRFMIAPRPGGHFIHAVLSWDSVYGTVGSRWERGNGKTIYTITIPGNCTAELSLPGFD